MGSRWTDCVCIGIDRLLLAAWMPLVLLLDPGTPVRAQETINSELPEVAGEEGDAPEGLTGDWGGLRTMLWQKGFELGVTYLGEGLGNPVGGTRRGGIYEGRLEMSFDLDFEKAVGWDGATFHANAYQIHGKGLSARDLGNNLLIASGIETAPSSRLFDLWLQQDLFERALSVRAGQIAADDEFFISRYAATFINATFGWPAILAADLPSGGPAYPFATPGVRVNVAVPAKDVSLSAAVFNGDSVGPGQGDPQERNRSGTNFRTGDGAFVIGELAYAVNAGKSDPGLPGSYKLGGWYHTGTFPDQRFDTTGRSLADPASAGTPGSHHGNYGFYLIADQMLWRRAGTADEGLGAFLRLSGSPADRNLVDLYADGGLTFKGLLPGRADDVLGLGAAFARMSNAAGQFDSDTNAFNGTNGPRRSFEAAIELTYRAQVTPWWTIQPDFQFIIHPGGNSANPNNPSDAIPNAFVLGLRSAIKF